jgi:hypothetical protein
MMEEEFGMREPPHVAKRFGRSSKSAPFSSPAPGLIFVSPGLPSKLKILPPKRKKTITQIPEPRRNSSFLKGSWETVWVCDVDDVDFVEPPLEGDSDPPSGSVSDDQDNSFNHAVATPTRVAPWSMDGEVTPRFSSNFLTTPDSDAWRREGHPDTESLRTSFSRPAEPHAPQ